MVVGHGQQIILDSIFSYSHWLHFHNIREPIIFISYYKLVWLFVHV